MKIIFLTRFFYPHRGGVEKHVAEVSRILINQGHEVVVATEQYERQLSLKEVRGGIRIFRIPFMTEDRLKKFRIWWWLLRNRGIITDADIVHAHDVFFWYLPFRFLYPFKKIFITFHGYEGRFPPAEKKRLIRRISKLLSTGSINVGEYIAKWYHTRAQSVTYGGVNQVENLKSKVKIQGQSMQILLVGRLEEDIGIRVYLEALQLFRGGGINAQFEALGDGPLKSQVKKWGKVHGFVEDTAKYISTADIIFASSYLTILEGLLQQKPVFAIHTNPLKKDYLLMSPFPRYIFISSSSRELVSQLREYLKNPQKYKNKIEEGYRFARSQTWDNVVRSYYSLWLRKN